MSDVNRKSVIKKSVKQNCLLQQFAHFFVDKNMQVVQRIFEVENQFYVVFIKSKNPKRKTTEVDFMCGLV